MALDWQDLAAAALVIAAVTYLVRAAWRTLQQRRAGCRACSTCPGDKPAERTLVTLDARLKAKGPQA